MLFQQFAPLRQRLAHYVLTSENEHIEDEEVEIRARGIVLQEIEGGLAVEVEGHHLAVDDRIVRHSGQRLHYARVAPVEVIVIP